MQPERIGRFVTVRLLGSGAFATVWLARDEDLDSLVAIKVLAENWSRNEDTRRRFMDEARAMRMLDSDRIVRVYEVGSLEDERPYMVMEYADRGTLQDRMEDRFREGGTFSIEEGVGLGIEIAACLADAHDRQVIHRDLKPSNVLFRSIAPERLEAMRRSGQATAEERVLLGDFGIARRLEGALGYTRVVGTPHYMAPEQAEPETAGQADYRSDIYSAAVVLYELLAGRVPFPYDSVTQVIRAQLEQGSPPITRFRPEVPPALAETIHRGLAADPQFRFGSAREWRDALAGALAGHAPPAPSVAGPAIPGPAETFIGDAAPAAMAGMGPGGPPVPPPPMPAPGPGTPPVPVPGGAPPPGPPYGGPPPAPPGRPPRRSRRTQQLVALGLVILLGIGVGVFVGTQQSEAAEILLQSKSSTAPDLNDDGREDPFTPPLDLDPDDVPETIQAVPKVTAKVGDVVTELFGGSGNLSQCAKEKLISFLQDNEEKALAWARTQGISVDEIPSFVRSLLPVETNVDLRVTNHGFLNGVATGFQAILEKGTALLVDAFGSPVVRCKCGNPLLPAEEVEGEPEYVGDRWPGFDPTVVVAAPAKPRRTATTEPVAEFGVFDVEGVVFVGTAQEIDDTSVCDLFPDAADCTQTLEDPRLLIGPFATREEAAAALCDAVVPGTAQGSFFFPDGISAQLSVDGEIYDLTFAPACEGVTPSPSPTEAPKAVNLSRGAVTEASSSTPGYEPGFGVDGLVTTSWFSAGKAADGDSTTYTLTFTEPKTVTRIAFVGNENHPEFPTGFGFRNWTIELKNLAGDTLLVIESAPGEGIFTQTADIPNTEGVDLVVFTGFDRESDDCGGFAELKVFGYASPIT